MRRFYLDIGWPKDCEDDHIAPPPPRPVAPNIWSVEFSVPWNTSAEVEIAFSQVVDSCPPVTYGIDVQRRTGGEWVDVVDEKLLAQPVYSVAWPANEWG